MVIFTKTNRPFTAPGSFSCPLPSSEPLYPQELRVPGLASPEPGVTGPYLPGVLSTHPPPQLRPRSPRSRSPQVLWSPGSAPRVTVQRAPCPYAVGRLAGLDAGLHQVHVRLHALDTRVAELSRGLRQLREVAGDNRDTLQALKEAQSRSEREHGRLEGESHRAGRGKRDDPGQVGDWWQKGFGKV